MKTATVLVNGATVAAAAAPSATGQAQTDLTALTVNDAIIHIKVVNAATSPGVGKDLEVFYAFTPNDQSGGLTASSDVLGPAATKVKVNLENIGSATREYETDQIKIRGRYVVVWYKHAADYNAAVTLTVTLIS